MELISFGAAQTVTGSKHLLRTSKATFLIDCGLYQGIGKKDPYELPSEFNEVDAVLLTHGHLDHSGYLPKLVKHGFQGPIFATRPTIEIAKLIMADNAKIQAKENRSFNKKQSKESLKKHSLYDLNDVAKTNALFISKEWDAPFSFKGVEISFKSAGHILGASSIKIKDGNKSIVFSGDLGRDSDAIMPKPVAFSNANAVVMECTYGDRNHDQTHDPESDLVEVLQRAKKSEGTILIPAFSVARSQNVLFYLSQIFKKQHQLKIPIYVDSALTTEVTKLYESFSDFHSLTKSHFKSIHKDSSFIEFKSQRDKLELTPGPKIILTASGMMTGGMAPHYLKILSDNKKNILMIVGYQAEGTLGREIVDGAREFSIDGENVSWTGEVFISKSFSSHADQQELLEWLNVIGDVEKVFLVHGEEESLAEMKKNIGKRAIIVNEKERYQID